MHVAPRSSQNSEILSTYIIIPYKPRSFRRKYVVIVAPTRFVVRVGPIHYNGAQMEHVEAVLPCQVFQLTIYGGRRMWVDSLSRQQLYAGASMLP